MTRARCLACVADDRNETAGNAFVLGLIMAGHVKGNLCGRHFALTIQTRPEPFNPPAEARLSGPRCGRCDLRPPCDAKGCDGCTHEPTCEGCPRLFERCACPCHGGG